MKSWTMAAFLVAIVFITPLLEALQKKCRVMDKSRNAKQKRQTNNQATKAKKTALKPSAQETPELQAFRRELFKQIKSLASQALKKIGWWIADKLYDLNDYNIETPPEKPAPSKNQKTSSNPRKTTGVLLYLTNT